MAGGGFRVWVYVEVELLAGELCDYTPHPYTPHPQKRPPKATDNPSLCMAGGSIARMTWRMISWKAKKPKTTGRYTLEKPINQ